MKKTLMQSKNFKITEGLPYEDNFVIQWKKRPVPRPKLPEIFDLTIEKWELIVKWLEEGNEFFRVFSDSCGLCYKFLDNPSQKSCKNCPVFLETGEELCEATPFRSYNYYFGKPNNRLKSAKKEVEFLKELKKKYAPKS